MFNTYVREVPFGTPVGILCKIYITPITELFLKLIYYTFFYIKKNKIILSMLPNIQIGR